MKRLCLRGWSLIRISSKLGSGALGSGPYHDFQTFPFDFRNAKEKHFEFTEKNVVFYGGNGKGKTNILEAISILSVGKSWRETGAEDLIRDQGPDSKNPDPNAVIQATLENGNLYEVKIAPRSRSFEKNAKKVSLRQHFGKIPTLLFVPEHLMLFSGTKRNRQRFF